MRYMIKKIIVVTCLSLAFPMLTLAADVTIGQVEYERNCIMCHGATGHGNGWLTEFLKKPVPSITQLKRKNGGKFPVELVHRVIDGRAEIRLHGPRNMPVWGQIYVEKARGGKGLGYERALDPEKDTETRILALIDYLATLQE